jgi:serine phosphatase RsbU (regulator of sigma subunit)
MPGSVKALQASLQHLTWQTKMIASGDFSQRVDFMGEFSESFNSMVTQLDESMQKLTIANAQLEESQARMRESLNCARVIQGSILPRPKLFDRLFREWFTLYRPCEIVGGDLYWLREMNGHILLAVIDCTGHGVPGAIMTMTVNSVLNHVVDTICSNDPTRILTETNRVLQETLHLRRDGESTVDAGLDIILCCIEPTNRRLTCAGAGLSLYLLTDGELTEIKGNRAGIGYSSSDPDFSYTNHVRDLRPGTICHAITDGCLDESGGAKGFGFGRQRFKEMVKQYADYPLAAQQAFFEQTLDEWRGTRTQRDDVTMVGFRI